MFWGVLLSLLTITSTTQDLSFEEHVLTGYSTKQSYYVSLLIHSKEYTGKAIIPNGNLFVHWKNKGGGNQFNYRQELKTLISTNGYYEVPESNIAVCGFIKVEYDPTVIAFAKAGKFRFFNHFFRGQILDVEGLKHFPAITEHLFKWKIAIQRDANTGWFIADTDVQKFLDIKNDISFYDLIRIK
ncbi:MAG: hypothetical protein D4R43_03970 [Sphingobacteriales bacterium]|nr:MAG: hypothetical protein D4R43_03970 [Sphingobacteriales bacterium]